MVVGSGLSTGGAVVWESLGTGDAVGVTGRLDVADGLTDGDRDGDGDRVGVGAVRVGLGVQVGVETGWTVDGPVSAFSDVGTGRTR